MEDNITIIDYELIIERLLEDLSSIKKYSSIISIDKLINQIEQYKIDYSETFEKEE